MDNVTLSVAPNGRVFLPELLRRRLDVLHGGTIVIREEQGRLMLESADDAVSHAQATVRRFAPNAVGVTDEFLDERRAERQSSCPSAFDRWFARPIMFGPALLIGSAVTLATVDTPQTAPFTSTLIPIGGVALAWRGLFAATDYIRSRWSSADPILLWALRLLFLAAIVAGSALVGRGISFFLLYLGLWPLIRLVSSWWKGRRPMGRPDPSR
jgi:bifunctional DNA-binding transcriptional regulator/antitoxin component of YhaV-PrlF toxin-antitoxin module